MPRLSTNLFGRSIFPHTTPQALHSTTPSLFGTVARSVSQFFHPTPRTFMRDSPVPPRPVDTPRSHSLARSDSTFLGDLAFISTQEGFDAAQGKQRARSQTCREHIGLRDVRHQCLFVLTGVTFCRPLSPPVAVMSLFSPIVTPCSSCRCSVLPLYIHYVAFVAGLSPNVAVCR